MTASHEKPRIRPARAPLLHIVRGESASGHKGEERDVVNAIRQIETNEAPTEAIGRQAAYPELIQLVRHLDTQILTCQLFHMIALIGLIPLGAFAVLEQAEWRGFLSLGLLAVALVANWTVLSTKLTLQKLCWTRELRELETELFPAGDGPFTRQKVFFDNLTSEDVGWFDRVLVQDIGTRRFQLVVPLALLAALLTTVLMTLVNY